MKQRMGFVSNSSSSSFIILRAGNEEGFDAFVEEITDYLDKVSEDWELAQEDDYCEFYRDVTHNMLYLSSYGNKCLTPKMEEIFAKHGIDIEWSGR